MSYEMVNDMPVGLLGKKIGMTRIFTDEGKVVPVTVVQAGPCTVVQRKNGQTDGYEAVQVGFEPRSRHRTNSPMSGHFESRGIAPLKYLTEFRVDAEEEYEEGQELTVELFGEGELVDVTGRSKGRGFAGVMKRHGFRGGPASHGSKVHRSLQSAGATDAQRIFPGTRMPGQMGNKQVTVQGLTVVSVDAEENVLLIRGGIPGPNGGLVIIRPARKSAKE